MKRPQNIWDIHKYREIMKQWEKDNKRPSWEDKKFMDLMIGIDHLEELSLYSQALEAQIWNVEEGLK